MEIKKKTYAYLLLIIFIPMSITGCSENKSDNKKEENKASFIEGLFNSSEAEKTHSEKVKAKSKSVQKQVEQLQQNRLNSY